MKYHRPVLLSLLFVFLLLLKTSSAQQKTIRVLFFGDSITAGYGLDKTQAYPAVLQELADSLKWNIEMVNGGLSGETSAGGLRRIDWMLQKPIDVFLLELGGNDGLRGLPLEQTEENLSGIIKKVQVKYPKAVMVLAGMQVPPNLGTDYTKQFTAMYPKIAKEFKIALIPFILEKVGGNPKLNLPDGIHPTAEGHKLVAETVWEKLEPILKKMNKL
ncbi:arylesterase [bacterium]|nr:MAG: arylesterase [bacterium]